MSVRDVGEEYKSRTSPNYTIGSKGFVTAIGTALALVLVNILGMVWLADTAVADLMVWTYTEAPLAPFLGLVIFGIALTAGRYFGLQSIHHDNLGFAAVMIGVVEVTYAVFGAGVLSMYPSRIWSEAIWITLVGVALYTLVVTGVVYSTNRSFEAWGGYAGVAMLIGILAVLGYTALGWPVLGLIGFAVITIGFMIDLVYEVWHTSNAHRSPLANGFAVYIAFMGVFVHVLQLVLEALADQ